MKKLAFAALAASIATLATQSIAQDVNIVYPINGGAYPITDPGPGSLRSAYNTYSFGVTCSGGPHTVEWGFNGSVLNSARFYDMISVQQVWKLPGGAHSFEVDAGRCGNDAVKFQVGN